MCLIMYCFAVKKCSSNKIIVCVVFQCNLFAWSTCVHVSLYCNRKRVGRNDLYVRKYAVNLIVVIQLIFCFRSWLWRIKIHSFVCLQTSQFWYLNLMVYWETNLLLLETFNLIPFRSLEGFICHIEHKYWHLQSNFNFTGPFK